MKPVVFVAVAVGGLFIYWPLTTTLICATLFLLLICAVEYRQKPGRTRFELYDF